jgi:hypothetical protein
LRPRRLPVQAPERGIEHLDGIPYTNHPESSPEVPEIIREEEDKVVFDLSSVFCPPGFAEAESPLSAIGILHCVVAFVNNSIM